MSKWKRILIALGTAIIVVGVYVPLFGVQTISALMVRYQFRNLPEVKRIPVPLTDQSVSSVRHKTASYFGYDVELPWDDVDDQKSRTTGSIQLTAFRSGNVFWFSTFPPKDFVKLIMKYNNLDAQGFRQLYGDDAFESDYGFHRKMLQTTPSEITPFVCRKQAIAEQMLILIKAISMPKADSGIFQIQSPGFEGFQFENPKGRPFKVIDDLYSNDGGIEVMFFQQPGGSAPDISQSEINRVIQSVRRITSSTANSPAPSN